MRRLTVSLVAVAGVAALVTLAGGAAGGAPAVTPPPVAVEMVVIAERAVWRSNGARGARLTFEGISPRMVVMAVAPHRRVSVLPAGMLSANWRRLFRAQRGWTNVVASLRSPGGRRRLVPLSARLVRGPRAGHRMVFDVRPLQRRGHRPDGFGGRRMAFEDVTLLVDPSITDAIRAIWKALVELFTARTFDIPPIPTSRPDGASITYDPVDFYLGSRATIAAIDRSGQITAQRAALPPTVTAKFTDDPKTLAPRDSITFTQDADRAAILPYADGAQAFQAITFDGTAGGRPLAVTNTSLYEVRTDVLTVRNAELGGANMRGLVAKRLDADHGEFKDVDLSGATLGSHLVESKMNNSVWDGVIADRVVRDADGRPDVGSKPASIISVDLSSTLFTDVRLANATIVDSRLAGSSFTRVDFSGADITSGPVVGGEKFAETFSGSILKDTKFDGANLENASFAGADFTDGGVSFDGAKLDDVDFTGAVGLQEIDWGKAIIGGPVFGLGAYSHLLPADVLLDHPEWVRWRTIDGERPAIDQQTGWDYFPSRELLVDPGSGVHFRRQPFTDLLVPVHPDSLARLQTADRHPLGYDRATGRLFDDRDPARRYPVDFESGRPEW